MSSFQPLPGGSRTVIRDRYALIAPDSHVPSVLPGWADTTAHILISPAMGADLVQTLLILGKKATGAGNTGHEQHFVYVLEGSCRLNGKDLAAGHYGWLPPATKYEITSSGAKIMRFAKRYEALAGTAVPAAFFGDAAKVAEEPFLGDPHARLRGLIPESNLGHDFAVNIFTFDPGATLPFVEIHIMEHGLLVLEGGGLYRLNDDWHPIAQGDVIWMAPYCPQWFIAKGPGPTRYLYSKNVNREARSLPLNP